jgi:hypothetical protein
MVRTIAKFGPWAGRPLWRCSDFSCPELINIEEGEDLTPHQPAAGESAQAHFERERLAYRERAKQWSVALALLPILIGAIGFLVVTSISGNVQVAGLVGIVVIGIAVVGLMSYVPNETVWWGKGAEAERAVGARLDSLSALGFVTLYDRRFVGRGGNIDAITIGPSGVFVVETKHRGRSVEVIAGRLEVGNRPETDVVRQVTDQAMLVQITVAQLMNAHRLTVVPVICIGNRTVSGGDRTGGVLVTDVKSIPKRLASEPAVLSPDDVSELARAIDRALPAYERRS